MLIAATVPHQFEKRYIINLKEDGSAYVTLIQSTAKFHNRLKLIFNEDKDELSPEQNRECNEYFASNYLKSLTKHKISLNEFEQVSITLRDYIDEISLLLAQINRESE